MARMSTAKKMLFSSVLCPIDFSEHSRQALHYAALLASRAAGRLVVIYVEDPMLAAAGAIAYNEKAMLDRARTELGRFVKRPAEAHRLPQAAITLDIAQGKPHEEIAWTAERVGCDLIVMGAHGLTGANRLMIGSTTHRVLRESALPVLATPPVRGRAKPPGKNWPGKSAVAPIDLAAAGDRTDAVAAAVVARELGTALELLHVVEPVAAVPWLEVDAARRSSQIRRKAEAQLSRIAAGLPVAVNIAVETGSPADVIAKRAAARSVGVVIMTRRRGQGLFGPRQGSISYQVLTKANTPVLALPGDAKWRARAAKAQ
jgi:nucleotide-binding universal stress UspA family protein